MFKKSGSQNNPQRCPICEEQGTQFVRPLSKEYNLLSCPRCQCRFCSPFSPPTPNFYTQATDLASSSRHSGPVQWYPGHPTRESNLFSQGKSGLLLDVGCGNGAFAEFASRMGYQVVGIDGDATSIEVARSRNLPAKFYCCTIDEFFALHPSSQQFDVVTMFEVFEHLHRPLPVLQIVKKLLRGEGKFVGSLPNTERPLMWQINMDYELPPYHLTYWTAKSWRTFLGREGFRILQCEPAIYYGYMSDVLAKKYKLPTFLQRIISTYFYPIEFKIEKHYKLGASFYFEAELSHK